MILAPKYGYTTAICTLSTYIIDDLWGDCSIIEGEEYNLLTSTLNDKYVLVKFRNGLSPHLRKHFKTKLELREDKLNSLL